jgi:hypothetical protein
MFRPRRFAPLAIALAVGLALSAGCSDDGDNPLAPAGSRVTTESGRAATETVGPAGGTVVATGLNGVICTLTILAGALATELATVTPITAIDGHAERGPGGGGGARAVGPDPDQAGDADRPARWRWCRRRSCGVRRGLRVHRRRGGVELAPPCRARIR